MCLLWLFHLIKDVSIHSLSSSNMLSTDLWLKYLLRADKLSVFQRIYVYNVLCITTICCNCFLTVCLSQTRIMNESSVFRCHSWMNERNTPKWIAIYKWSNGITSKLVDQPNQFWFYVLCLLALFVRVFINSAFCVMSLYIFWHRYYTFRFIYYLNDVQCVAPQLVFGCSSVVNFCIFLPQAIKFSYSIIISQSNFILLT